MTALISRHCESDSPKQSRNLLGKDTIFLFVILKRLSLHAEKLNQVNIEIYYSKKKEDEKFYMCTGYWGYETSN